MNRGLMYAGIALAVIVQLLGTVFVILGESQGSYDHPVLRGIFWFPRLLFYGLKRLFRFDV